MKRKHSLSWHPWAARLILIGGMSFGLFLWLGREDAASFVLARMRECYPNGRSSCYEEAVAKMYSRFSVPEVLNAFTEHEQKLEIFSRCHEAAHYLGRLAYQKTHDIQATFRPGSAACWGGYYHGAVEQYLGERNLPIYELSDEKISQEVLTICGERDDYERPALYGECVHGIGHAGMFVTDGDLLRSLYLCDFLSDTFSRELCWGGAFMENSSTSTNNDHPPKFVKEDDPLYPCTILAEKYLGICYMYQSSYFARLTKYDWKKTTELCQSVPREYRNSCFYTIGTNQVGFTQDLEAVREHCSISNEPYHISTCIQGVVDGLAGRYNTEFSRPIKFCSIVATGYQEACYTQLIQVMQAWVNHSGELERHCRLLPEMFVKQCLESRISIQPDTIMKKRLI